MELGAFWQRATRQTAYGETRSADRSRRGDSSSDFRHAGAQFTWTEPAPDLEIGVGDFDHLTAPFFALLASAEPALERY